MNGFGIGLGREHGGFPWARSSSRRLSFSWVGAAPTVVAMCWLLLAGALVSRSPMLVDRPEQIG
jgi:hypothetical protein